MTARRHFRLVLAVGLAFPAALSIPSGTHAATVGTGPCASEVGTATGVTVVTDGADCVISFKNVGSTTWEVPATVGDVDVLLVGGGGGGGGTFDTVAAGGGGAGGMREWTSHSVTPGSTLTVTVGAGGAGGAGATNAYGYAGATGGSSSFDSLSVSGGGGGGGGRTWGVAGGSGGGGGGRTTTLLAGSGISGEGNSGGQATGAFFGGGGGGGKSAAGANSTSTAGGAGGAGAQSSVDTVTTVYATGGGGATHNVARSGSAGTANTGNGGDGAGCGSGCGRAGGAGGSGIVVVRYAPGSAPTTTTTTSTTTTTTTIPVDTTAPSLASTSPVDGATSVSPVASLSMTFDENVSAVSGKEITLYKTIGAAVVERFSVTDTSRVTISGRVVTIDPTASLEWSTIYFVRVDAGAFRDAAGNAFAGIWSQTDWNFTTAVDPSPTTTTPTATTTTVTVAPQATSTPTTSNSTTPGGSATVASTTPSTTATSSTTGAGSSATSTAPSTATSTSTTTTTTIPEAPLATSAFTDDKGARVALVDGVPVEVASEVAGEAVVTRVGAASMILSGVRTDGGTVLPNTNGALPMREGDTVTVVAEGFASFSPIDVWVYSDPVYLGRKDADGFGRATLVTTLPDLPPGEHDIVIDGESREGARITLATSLTILDDLEEESVVRRVGTVAVWTLLIGGLLAGLLVPGRIRRRGAD